MDVRQLEEKKKKYNTLLIVGALIIVISILLFLVNPLAAILFIIGLIITLTANQKIKEINNQYKQANIETLLSKYLDEFTFDTDAKITYSDYKQANMPQGNRQYFNDSICGKYKDVYFDSTDTLIQQVTSTGKTTTVVTVFEGLFIRIFKDFNLKGNLCISEKSQSTWFSSYEKVELESIEFNEKFSVIATDEIDAFYVLKPQVMELLMDLEKKYLGSFCFNFINDVLYVGLYDNKDRFSVGFNKKFDQSLLDEFEKDILMIIDIIDHLDEL